MKKHENSMKIRWKIDENHRFPSIFPRFSMVFLDFHHVSHAFLAVAGRRLDDPQGAHDAQELHHPDRAGALILVARRQP